MSISSRIKVPADQRNTLVHSHWSVSPSAAPSVSPSVSPSVAPTVSWVMQVHCVVFKLENIECRKEHGHLVEIFLAVSVTVSAAQDTRTRGCRSVHFFVSSVYKYYI